MTTRLSDIVLTAAGGLRARRTRVALSSAGIALGIATIVSVVGISASSRAAVLRQLDRLGTNLLTVQPGRAVGGDAPVLPTAAPSMVSRIPTVQRVTAVSQVDATVHRNDKLPAADTGALIVTAAHADLLEALGASVAQGRFLDAALERYPTAVLGSAAAVQLGVDRTDGSVQVLIGGTWFAVVGILDPVPLVGDLDRAALIGYPEAQALTGADPTPTAIYVRVAPEHVPAVEGVLAATANPAHPNTVSVARPSDALAARAAAKTAFTGLLLGLGAVALLVGALGIANVMVVAVLERRSEIGLRRALGATRTAIGAQFLTEALLLAVLGGTLGVVAGAAVTRVWAGHQQWPSQLPPAGIAAAIAASAAAGALAGLLPAVRAARLTPTEALRT
jgi:putative ABC transport system permease protein